MNENCKSSCIAEGESPKLAEICSARVGNTRADSQNAKTAILGKDFQMGFSEAQLQHVHGAGETLVESCRDSTRSYSMDSSDTSEHKADAELVLSFLTEMHSTGGTGQLSRGKCESTQPSQKTQKQPERTYFEEDSSAWATDGESLLLSLRAKKPGIASSSSSSQLATPETVSKQGSFSSESISTLSAHYVKSPDKLITTSKTDPGRKDSHVRGPASPVVECHGDDEDEDADAKIIVSFRHPSVSNASFSDSGSGELAASSEEETDMWEDNATKPRSPRHPRADSASSWNLFNSLVNEAGNGSRKLERQLTRTYECPWHRVGYYRRCHDKYGQDASIYDSEDSDYEEASIIEQRDSSSGCSRICGGSAREYGPYTSEFSSVRANMLNADKSADRAVAGGVPKYHRDWGRLKRRGTMRQQQRLKREARGRIPPNYNNVTTHDRIGADAEEDMEVRKHNSAGATNLGNLTAAAREFAVDPQRTASKKEKVASNSGGKSKNVHGSSGSLKKSKITGQSAPKRQSTALTLSFEVQENGLIRCKRCGKPNFKNHFALRSHLSHCPGTIHMKEQRMKIEAGLLPPETPLCLPVDEDERQKGPSNAAWVPAFNVSSSGSSLGASRSVSGSFSTEASDQPAPPTFQRADSNSRKTASEDQDRMHASTSCASKSDNRNFVRNVPFSDPLQQPPRDPTSSATANSAGTFSFKHEIHTTNTSASSPPEPTSDLPVHEGTALVPAFIADGNSFVGRVVSYKNHGARNYVDVYVRSYRSRRNCHFVVYPDTTSEWVILTDRNCRWDAGHRANLSDASSSPIRPAAERKGILTSITESTHFGSGTPNTASPRSPPRNVFFSEQDALLLPRRPLKRKADSVRDEEASSTSFTTLSEERVARKGEKSDKIDTPKPKIRRVDSNESLTASVGAPGPQHYHSHNPTLPYAQHIPHHSTGPPAYPYHVSTTGYTAAESYAMQLAQHTPASTFICRRCAKSFHNKQALGWHTRKGCYGHPGTAITNNLPSPFPNSSVNTHSHAHYPPSTNYMYGSQASPVQSMHHAADQPYSY
ncbi:Zinc finger, C2H2 [Nannochloropsis gaditana]|uniref:Zinc finger, C2H2 n=1 Tax=Nannochloropsis gaditana TaxID=72520 RepID=W7U1A9_9STRA|nr:Zinc finger, C2H2 [Nannochloropsis gaditana]